jgi:hypothetical protein
MPFQLTLVREISVEGLGDQINEDADKKAKGNPEFGKVQLEAVGDFLGL